MSRLVMAANSTVRPRALRAVLGRGVLVGLLALTALAGCVPRYRMTLTNGSIITTRGKPKLDKEQGVYRFQDAKGQPGYVPVFKVKELEAL